MTLFFMHPCPRVNPSNVIESLGGDKLSWCQHTGRDTAAYEPPLTKQTYVTTTHYQDTNRTVNPGILESLYPPPPTLYTIIHSMDMQTRGLVQAFWSGCSCNVFHYILLSCMSDVRYCSAGVPALSRVHPLLSMCHLLPP